MPILHGRLRGRKWIVGSSVHGCWLGSYELAKRRAFEAIVTPGAIVFDIGAHVGFYTLLAAILVGRDGRVFAFDPVPSNLWYLREHLRLNDVTNVTVVEAAVSNESGLAHFREGATSSTGQISEDGHIPIRTVALDDLVASGDVPVPQFIKIDVEGAELAVLAGGRMLLAEFHPTIFLGTHSATIHEQCCTFLRDLGYQLESLDWEPLERSSEVLAR